MRLLLLTFIRLYRACLSPLLPVACRFTPTCSAYAHDAVARFGAIKGSLLASKRILRCHPLGGQGFDPVPSVREKEPTR